MLFATGRAVAWWEMRLKPFTDFLSGRFRALAPAAKTKDGVDSEPQRVLREADWI